MGVAGAGKVTIGNFTYHHHPSLGKDLRESVAPGYPGIRGFSPRFVSPVKKGKEIGMGGELRVGRAIGVEK